MNQLYFIFRLVKTIIGINKFNSVHSAYHRQAKILIEELTAPFNLENVPEIPSNAKLKMQWYMAQTLYACENFNLLSGHRSTVEQRRTYLLSGAVGFMSDLIIDDVELDLERIKMLKRPSTDFQSGDVVEELYVACYYAFLEALDKDVKELTLHYYELLFQAQFKSKEQFDPNLSRQEADKICREKGGYSVLFLRAMVTATMEEDEKNAWFEIGALIQYCNDAQDLHKDLQKKMRTFASTRSELTSIAEEIDNQKTTAFSLIKKLPYHDNKKDDLLFSLDIMCIAILSKLHAFSRICNYDFSFDKFAAKTKKEVRSKTSPLWLFRYWFPKVIKYQYEKVEAPYQFDYELTNKNPKI